MVIVRENMLSVYMVHIFLYFNTVLVLFCFVNFDFVFYNNYFMSVNKLEIFLSCIVQS